MEYEYEYEPDMDMEFDDIDISENKGDNTYLIIIVIVICILLICSSCIAYFFMSSSTPSAPTASISTTSSSAPPELTNVSTTSVPTAPTNVSSSVTSPSVTTAPTVQPLKAKFRAVQGNHTFRGKKTWTILIKKGHPVFRSIAEVEIYDSNNKKIKLINASQSSTAVGGLASRAIDGNIDGNFFNNSVSHTDRDNRYWSADIDFAPGQNYDDISKISIYNRTDCCTERLNNASIIINCTDEDKKLTGHINVTKDSGIWQDVKVKHFTLSDEGDLSVVKEEKL